MYGYHSKVMVVDLTRQESKLEPLTSKTLYSFIGGVGLAAWLLYKHAAPGVDPFSAEAPLIFASSPFLAAGLPGSTKLAVACKSPLTGFIGDSLASGPVAEELKKMPFDALVITGKANGPTFLYIEDFDVRFHDAGRLLGLPAGDVEREIASVLEDPQAKIAAIGPAGEALVRYACITNHGRQAGRTGAGAVMGSKNLKAIALKGNASPMVACPDELEGLIVELDKAMESKATAKYRGPGTVANLSRLNAVGALPAYNFRTGTFEGAEGLGIENLERRRDPVENKDVSREWEHLYATLKKGGVRTKGRLEYESLFALGPLCGVDDPDVVIQASALCDRLGLDTISTGGAVAWAMESFEKGVLTSSDFDGLDLRFGEGDVLLATVEKIGRREGVGDLLAEGSRMAARKIGGGSEAWAMQVKGLEMPGYHPRRLKHLALGLAVSPRGACHNRSSAYDADLADNIDGHGSPSNAGKVVADAEDFSAVLDSLILSKFVRNTFTDFYGETAHIYRLITGFEITSEDLRAAGERINNLRKAFNLREGWARADDTLPTRAFEGGDLSQEELNEMILGYYKARGWTPGGLIPEAKLHQLGLANIVDTGTASAVT